MTTPQTTKKARPQVRPVHADNCACGVCVPPTGSEIEKRMYVRVLPAGAEPPQVREGDHVWVEQGHWRGTILDLKKIEEGSCTPFVCSRTTFPYEVRTKRVSLYRRRRARRTVE